MSEMCKTPKFNFCSWLNHKLEILPHSCRSSYSLHPCLSRLIKRIFLVFIHIFIKLILIEHKVFAMTVDDVSDIDVAAKMLHTHLQPSSTEDLYTLYKITIVSRWAPRLVSPIQYLTKCEIWSQSPILFMSYGVE